MKRILTFALALILALSLCACREQKAGDAAQTAETPEPTEVPKTTPAEAVAAAMDANNGVESGHISASLTMTMNRTPGSDAVSSIEQSGIEAQIEADFIKTPLILKGTLRLKLSGNDYVEETEEVPFCLWQEDGQSFTAVGYESDGEMTWMGSSVGTQLGLPGTAVTQDYLEQYHTLLRGWSEQFEAAGEMTVNGETAAVYEAQIDAGMLRTVLETYTDANGEPLITFSDDLVAALPPIRLMLAINADGIPVYQEIDAAAFVSKLLERIIYSQIAEEGETFALDTLLIKQTISDVNAVGPIEIPEDIQIYDYSTAMPGITGLLGV